MMMVSLPIDLRAPFGPGGSNEIDSSLASRLIGIALATGGDYADLYFEFRVSADYALEEEEVRSLGRGITVGLGVRVTLGDATGYAYTEDLAWERMSRAARTAGQIAKRGGHPPVHAADLERIPITTFVPDVVPSLVASPADKLALLTAADHAARACDSRIAKVEVLLAESLKEMLLFTSDGRMVHDVQPLLRFGVRAVAESKSRKQIGTAGGGGRCGMDYFTLAKRAAVAHGHEAARIATVMIDAVDAPAGEMTVVLAPGDSGILVHEAVGHGLEADFNRKKTSSYAARLGERVASPLCTIVDDATVPGSHGTINIDDEGYAGRRNVLIEQGVLVGYMHDRVSAMHFGVEPSGNGRRESFRAMPLPRMTNTLLLGGEHSADEIVASVKRGVYAKRFSGGQVSISDGDFVFSLAESYLIEDGKITAPIRGVNLIGNGPEIMRRMDMLGNDYELSEGTWTCAKEGQLLPVNVGTPTIRIASITVGGTQT